MTWLLDTNMLVYARNGVAKLIQRLDEAWAQGDVVTSLLVLGELAYGAEKSARKCSGVHDRLQPAFARTCSNMIVR